MNQDKNPTKDSSGREQEQNNETPIYLTDNSTLQTPAEHQHDESVDPRKSSRIDVSNDDLRETDADKLAGSDRAGTAERKDNSV